MGPEADRLKSPIFAVQHNAELRSVIGRDWPGADGLLSGAKRQSRRFCRAGASAGLDRSGTAAFGDTSAKPNTGSGHVWQPLAAAPERDSAPAQAVATGKTYTLESSTGCPCGVRR